MNLHAPPIGRASASLLVCIALALSTLAAPASAQSVADARARELYLRGDRYYSEGRYEEAVQDFLASYRLSGRPLLLFNLANAYERLGRYEDALDALRRYAPHASARESAEVRVRMQNLEQRVAQQNAIAESASEATEPAPEPSAPAYDEGLLIGGIAIGGAGVVVAITGVVMGVLALDARSEAQSGCVETGGVTLCDESARSALDRDAAFALVADVGVGVGAAALVAGVVMAILAFTSSGSESADDARSARVAPYAAPRAQGGELGVVVTY